MVLIRTDRLFLREFEKSDWPIVHEYAGDSDVTSFLEWGPNSEEQTKTFVQESIDSQKVIPRVTYDFAVIHRADDKLIGGCGMAIVDEGRTEAAMGYVLNRRYWSQGYATEAARGIIQFGFESLKLRRVFATCDALNIASQRVLVKSGMKKTNELDQDREVKGRMRDTFFFEIRASAWRAANATAKT